MKIAIIGAGAAGMMAAAAINEADSDAEVVLIEKNGILGRKVILSGGGRCNVTTGVRDVKQLLDNYYRGSKFLNSAMHQFTPEQVYNWFEDHGVPLKTQEDHRVFPQSDDGKDIVGVFERMFVDTNTEVLSRESVISVSKLENKEPGFVLTLKSGKTLEIDKLILTTGGTAYRHTGSTGDGYNFAEALGHSITDLAPSLNSFLLKEQWPKELSGVSFENIGLSIKGNKQYTATGPALFTHKGITGPAIFALASQIAFEEYSNTKPFTLVVNFLPAETQEKLRDQLNQIIDSNPKEQLQKTVHQWIPKSVTKAMWAELSLPVDILHASASKAHRLAIVNWLTACEVSIVGRGPGSEFVTAGGIALNEVNPSTMESKISPGLFFAGELLNIDGVTGGFNLQAAWATGRLAGMNAV